MDKLRAAAEAALTALVESDPLGRAGTIEKLRAALAEQDAEPVAWHHPDCHGECIACLIEREVQAAFGNQGVAYLRKRVTMHQFAEVALKEKNT